MGLHHVESWSEALSPCGCGERAALAAEKLGQILDLERWGAFRSSLRKVAAMLPEVAEASPFGRSDDRPKTFCVDPGAVASTVFVTKFHQRPTGRLKDGGSRPATGRNQSLWPTSRES